jgi:tetratricopeptide (TPR) repeat protein
MAEGLSFHQQGQLNMAQQRYTQVLQLQPQHFDALHLMGVLASQTQQPQRAVELITQALQINSRVAGAYINLGVALRQLKQYQAAVEAYDHALRLQPQDTDTLINRGVAMRALHQHAQALESYNQALAFQPQRAEALYNRGLLFNDLNRLPEAIADFEATLRVMPHYHPARWGQTLCHLQAGQLALGWQTYDIRWLQDEKEFTTPTLVTAKPQWQRGDHPSRLLIWPEQGVGDELMWGSLLQQAKVCADQLLVQLDTRLIPLFQRAMPDVAFLSKGLPVDEALFDAHLPIGDLAGLFCNEFSDFQNIESRYVSADPARVQVLRAQLSSKDSRPLCGISWRSKNDKRGQDRSMTLRDLVQAIGPDQVRFVNLQYGDVSDEIAQLKSVCGVDVIQCTSVDNFNDLDGLAALIDACDWVISVDNSTVHLAGALGKPVWVLLPFNADWRWFLNRRDSPWYPSATLYRQDAIADWSSVMSQIRSDVQTRCKQLNG